MNQQDAKRDACRVVALLIDNYFAVGQPWSECAERNPKHRPGESTCADCTRQANALESLMHELERRSDGAVPVSWQR